MKRRLAAILASDVVGYSALMAADEAGTLARLTEQRRRLFEPSIAARGGRIVKLMGDGALVEFESAVDAVAAALSIQQHLADTQEGLQLRIGINLGDVIVEEEDIYGDGVNIAARLEALAAPGGICISSTVQEMVAGRVEARFADAGQHAVKNIARPIQVYRWPDTATAGQKRRDLVPKEFSGAQRLAVEPLRCLSDDAELGYFCAGLDEDILAALANVEQVSLVSASDAGEAAYRLSGSVRRSGRRLRIVAKLDDLREDRQIWRERFDRDGEDEIAVQDDVTRRVAIGVHTALGAGSYTNRWQWGTDDFEAWQAMAKGFAEFQVFSPESFRKALGHWDRALAQDPDYLAPLLASAYARAHLAWIEAPATAQELIAQAQSAIDRAVVQAPDDLRQYAGKRALAFAQGDGEAALAAAETAFALAPNDSYTQATLGYALTSLGRFEEALPLMTAAAKEMQSLPGWFLAAQLLCHLLLEQSETAYELGAAAIAEQSKSYPTPALTAAAAAACGKSEEAEALRALMLRQDPRFRTEVLVRWLGLQRAADRQALEAALHAAGFA